ncbi:MAG: DUF72 domain-containing protein, partial [Sphingomonas sp.]
DFGAFLKLLPANQDGIVLRHAVQVRHESFIVPEFVALCRAAGVAIVYAESPDYPALADISGDIVYARLESSVEQEPLGYAPAALDHWAGVARDWATGAQPGGLPYASEVPPPRAPRDTYVFFISGAKQRNPQAAMALIERVR